MSSSELLFYFCALRASRRLHCQLLRNILRQPMPFFDTSPIGRILSRFSSDISALDDDVVRVIIDWTYCFYEVTKKLRESFDFLLFPVSIISRPVFLCSLLFFCYCLFLVNSSSFLSLIKFLFRWLRRWWSSVIARRYFSWSSCPSAYSTTGCRWWD